MIESGYIAAPFSGAHVEGLQVLEVLAERGATSIGYRVTDGERMLFMKRLRPELLADEGMRMTFRKEYEVGCRVQSPHVVRYVDFHEAADDVYLLMEFVAGPTLLERLWKASPEGEAELSVKQVLTWFAQLLEGLRALHNEGILHLDIKPDNLIISDVNQHLVIADLGYSHQDSYLAPVGKTQGYAAPELSSAHPSSPAEGSSEAHSRRRGTIDVRADLYSAGKVLKFMLDRVAERDAQQQEGLRRICTKCCAEQPDDRYRSADEMLAAIEALRTDKGLPRIGTTRRPLLAALLAVLLLGVAGYGIWRYRHVGYYFGMEFRVTSTDSMTCEVCGPADRTLLGRLLSPPPSGCENCALWSDWTFVDAPIPEKMNIGGRTYRVTSVADEAFFGVRTLGAVTFPPTIRHLGGQGFKECKALSSLTLPDSLESYGGIEVFQNCEGLTTLRLPKRLRTLAPHMFVHCLKLKDLVLPDSLTVLPEHAFMSCKSLTEVRIPACVRVIERGVFWDCQSLQRLYIPQSVETIADYAFGQCPALTDVYVEWPRPIIVADIFARSHPRVHVPKGAAELYRSSPVWKDYEIVED